MSTIARIAVEVDAKTAQFERGMAQAAKTAETVGRSLQRYVTLPLTAIAGASVYVASNYNASMNRVAAVTQATGDQLEVLSDQAKELGRTTRYSAGQAADAMGFLGMAGFNTEQIMSAMPSTLQLAAAAQLDLAEAADITSNILTGYSMSTEELGHANDVLVSAFTGANTNLSQLGEAMKYVGPVASGMGQSFEGTAAAIALLGNAGIQGSMAGTTLRGALGALASPTKEAAAVMQEFGIKVTDSQGQLLQMADIIEQFEKSGIDATKMMELFGLRAGPGMISLVEQGSVAFREFEQRLESSGGLAERVADKNMEGLSGALISMKSVLEGVSLEIGEALTPAILKMVDVVKAASTWFIELEETQRNTVVAIGALAAATGPLLILLGQMPKVLGAIRVGLTLIATHPVVFAVVAIGAAIAGVITYFDAWEETIIGVKAVLGTFGTIAETILMSLGRVAIQMAKTLMAPFESIAKAAAGDWKGAWGTLKDAVLDWGDVAVSIANDAKTAFVEMAGSWTDAISKIQAGRVAYEMAEIESTLQDIGTVAEQTRGITEDGIIDPAAVNENIRKARELEDRLKVLQERYVLLMEKSGQLVGPEFSAPEAPELPAPNVAAIRPMEIPMIAQQEPLELPEPPVWDTELMSRTNEQLAQQHDEWLRVTDATNQGSESLARYYAEQEKAQAQQTTWNEQFAQTQTAVEGFGGVMGNVAAGIYQNWNNVGQFLRNWRRQIIAQFVAVIAKAAVVSAVLSVIPGFGQANAAASGFSILTKGVKGIFGLAEGGLVTKPTLAMVGEGGESEAIIPLSKLGDISGGGRPVEVHTHVEVGGREVAEYVTKDIMNNLQRRAAV